MNMLRTSVKMNANGNDELSIPKEGIAVGTRLRKARWCKRFGAMKRTWALVFLFALTGCSAAIIESRRRAWGSPETANLDSVLQASIDPDKEAT